MQALSAELRVGEAAHALLADAAFRAAWAELHAACPHATAFQSPGFASAWYRVYRPRWQPVIVRAADARGALRGLWLLARDAAGRLAHAGAHQAEYQGWIAAPGWDAAFLEAAWPRLLRELDLDVLRLRYLPSTVLADRLVEVPALAGRVALRRHRRPLLGLDPAALRASLAKKGNRSRLNRLARLGTLEFRRLDSRAGVEALIDELIACYDLRQGAVNGTTPFAEDALKREFHCALLEEAAAGTCVTATLLDGRPVAAFWGALSGTVAHLGMLIHSPLLAGHSPGKLHLMALCEHLLQQGVRTLDLTPGGDPWKERFCDRHDEVAEVRLYRSAAACRRDAALAAMQAGARRCLVRLGVEPARLRAAWKSAGGRAAGLLRPAGRGQQPERLYRARRGGEVRSEGDERVRCNALPELLAFAVRAPDRDAFLAGALDRLERGARAYTLRGDARAVLCAWLAPDPAGEGRPATAVCCRVEAGGEGDEAPARALLAHLLREAFADAAVEELRLAVPACAAGWEDAALALGFEALGTPPAGPRQARPATEGGGPGPLEVRDA